MMKRHLIILPLISLLYLIFASCKGKYCTTDGETWGTTYHIVYSGASSLADSVRCEMESIDRELSMFNPSSTVSLVNSGSLTAVGRRFTEVFDIARYVCRLSGGAYDPTVGPLCELWGFGLSDYSGEPSDSALAEAMSVVGMLECTVDSSGNIHKKSPGTRFDFSSVAKGYGIDCIGSMLERNGVENYMIEIGGEVLACGVNPQGRPWHIQIDSPTGGFGHEALEIMALGPEKKALASSGNYRNYRSDSSGKTFGHIVSPQTGRPAGTSILSATVRADNCALADALATACMAVGTPDSAMAVLRSAGAEGLLVVAGDDGIETLRSPMF